MTNRETFVLKFQIKDLLCSKITHFNGSEFSILCLKFQTLECLKYFNLGSIGFSVVNVKYWRFYLCLKFFNVSAALVRRFKFCRIYRAKKTLF